MSAPRSATDWTVIRRTLEARGLWDEDGISRRAKARLCGKCKRPVMVGLDSDTAALAVVADPIPLSALGEAIMLLQERATYSLAFTGGRYELDYRDQWRISGAPAGTKPFVDIVAEHKCGAAEPAEQLRAGSTVATPKPTPTAHGDECPF